MIERINLVPQIPIAERLHRLTPWVVGLSLVAILLSLYLGSRHYRARVAALENEILVLEQERQTAQLLEAKLQQLADQVAQLRRRNRELAQEAASLERPVTERRHVTAMLSHLSMTVPSSVRLDKLFIGEEEGFVTGTAVQYRDLPGFVAELERSPLFENVSLKDIGRDEKNPQGRFLFTITFQLGGP